EVRRAYPPALDSGPGTWSPYSMSPGRFDVDEIRAEPFPSGHTSRSWGRMIRRPDGRVVDEPWPWDRVGSWATLAIPTPGHRSNHPRHGRSRGDVRGGDTPAPAPPVARAGGGGGPGRPRPRSRSRSRPARRARWG